MKLLRAGFILHGDMIHCSRNGCTPNVASNYNSENFQGGLCTQAANKLCCQNVWQCPNLFAQHPGIREVWKMFVAWEGLNGAISIDLK